MYLRIGGMGMRMGEWGYGYETFLFGEKEGGEGGEKFEKKTPRISSNTVFFFDGYERSLLQTARYAAVL
jgi:hypothetical protein